MNYYRFAADPARYDFEWDGQALTPTKAAPGSLGAVPEGGVPWVKLLLWGAVGYVAYKAMSGPRSNPDEPEIDLSVSEELPREADRDTNLVFREAAGIVPIDPQFEREAPLVGRIVPSAGGASRWRDGEHDADSAILAGPGLTIYNRIGDNCPRPTARERRAASPDAPAKPRRRRGRRAARHGSRLRPFEGK